MKVSGVHYLFILGMLMIAVIGLSCEVGAIVAVSHRDNAIVAFEISFLIGAIIISWFHFAKGRNM